MNGRYLLDTNVAVAVLTGKLDLKSRQDRGAKIFLNVIVLGELFFGAEKSQRAQENIERTMRLAEVCPVLPCDQETAGHYGIFKKFLEAKGRPIPENDVWIAASARQHGLTLVTRDGHFDYIEDLRREKW